MQKVEPMPWKNMLNNKSKFVQEVLMKKQIQKLQ